LKNEEGGTVGTYKITWKQISKSSLDQKKLKEEKPEVYEDYTVQSSYRRLSIA